MIAAKFNRKILFIMSLVIAVLMAFTSMYGVFFQELVYPNQELLNNFVPNNLVNLTIGLPFLLFSTLLAWRDNLLGLLAWPGALFYCMYIYFPYLICIPFNMLFLFHLFIFSFSIYVFIGALVSIDAEKLISLLNLNAPTKYISFILLGLALFIVIRQIDLIRQAIEIQKAVDITEIALWIADFSIASPVMLISGFLMYVKKQLGFVIGIPMLIAYGILSFGLVPFLYFQSHMMKTAMPIADMIILTIMAAICIVPLIFFKKVKQTT